LIQPCCYNRCLSRSALRGAVGGAASAEDTAGRDDERQGEDAGEGHIAKRPHGVLDGIAETIPDPVPMGAPLLGLTSCVWHVHAGKLRSRRREGSRCLSAFRRDRWPAPISRIELKPSKESDNVADPRRRAPPSGTGAALRLFSMRPPLSVCVVMDSTRTSDYTAAIRG
jgi:hypothetical protein